MSNNVANWGKDHWSTFAYAETRCVDFGGVLQNERMRTHARRHPLFLSRRGLGAHAAGDQYPTRLKEEELPHHDDWDCLHDLETQGLLKITSPREALLWCVPEDTRGPIRYKGRIRTKELTTKVRLTDLGRSVAAELREHLQSEHNFGTFTPSFAPAVVAV